MDFLSRAILNILDWTVWPIINRLFPPLVLTQSKADVSHPIFGVTLAQVLENQGGEAGDDEPPKVLTSLLSAIRLLGGTEREGIFRVTANQNDKLALRQQLESGNYNIQFTGAGLDEVDIPAGVLRDWLRELKEPVVPQEFYSSCIDVAKTYQNDSFALDYEVCLMFSTFPRASRLVLQSLTGIVREIDANAAKTKMNIPNLAIVFAPTLLFTPSDDFDSLVINNQYERAFVASLFRSIPLQPIGVSVQ